MERERNNKRTAECFDDEDVTETQGKAKRKKSVTEVYEAIITVNGKGKCSFEVITDSEDDMKQNVLDTTNPSNSSVQCEKVVSANGNHWPLQSFCTESTKCDKVNISIENIEGANVDIAGCNSLSDNCVNTSTETTALNGKLTLQNTGQTKTTSACLKPDSNNVHDLQADSPIPDKSEYVALDCEFVGVKMFTENGVKLDISALGRCSIVNFEGKVLCDIYARPKETITNYRTRYSGITKSHLRNAVPQGMALNQIANIIKDKIVVGHALKNDFSVLGINHPVERRRDTSLYPPFIQRYANGGAVGLKTLAKFILGKIIQKRSHCSVIDAQTTMDVFKTEREEWERNLLNGTLQIDEQNKEVGKPTKKKSVKVKLQSEACKRTADGSDVSSFECCKGAVCKYTCSNASTFNEKRYKSGNHSGYDGRVRYNGYHRERSWVQDYRNAYRGSGGHHNYFEDEYWPNSYSHNY